MKKKKSKTNINSGVLINDSIILSLEKKQKNNRPFLITIIAILGFGAVINSFFSMFPLNFDVVRVYIAAILFSAIDIFISLKKGKTLWIIPAMFAVFGLAVYFVFDKIVFGYKCTYNAIYKISNYTNIDYYREVSKHKNQQLDSVTIFLIAVIFLIAFIIYFFTIYKANPIAIVAVTFPVIEIGLYHGIELSVFWGILLIAYWFAVLAITFADMEEYDGGKGGFTRKGNLFFPKRSMKFKVTEKCALGTMMSIMCIGVVSLGIMKAVGYERSEELNLKRNNLKEAMNAFSIEDLPSSINSVAESLGIASGEDNRLGNKGKISFKNVTDLSVTFDNRCKSAVYLKGFVGSVYKKNEWFTYDENVYKKNSRLFDMFKKYEIYPQEFPYYSLSATTGALPINTSIKSVRKKNKCFVPYFTSSYGDPLYTLDTLNTYENKEEYECRMMSINLNEYSLNTETKKFDDDIDVFLGDELWDYLYEQKNYDGSPIDVDSIIPKEMFSINRVYLLESLLENDYRKFVYDNYLSYPDNKSFEQIYDEYADVLDGALTYTNDEKLETLNAIRTKMNSTVKYTLSPGKTPSNRDFVNHFLLENHKGYCVHYASAGVMLARMAGIPARYATGYIITESDFSKADKNADGSYTVKVKDSFSHAWAEIYLDGIGWVPYEFTSGYSEDEPSSPATTTTHKVTKITTTRVRRSTSRTQRSTKITKTTTVSYATTAANHKEGKGGGFGKKLHKTLQSRIFRNISFIIVIIAFVILLLYVRRKYILNKRRKMFKNSDYSAAVSEIYGYTLKLLEFIGMNRQNNAYGKFAEDVEKEFAGKYFENGEFERFMQISLKAVFDKEKISADEKKYVEEFAEKMSQKLYASSSVYKKMQMKITDVLI